jgi:hypothetical protein
MVLVLVLVVLVPVVEVIIVQYHNSETFCNAAALPPPVGTAGPGLGSGSTGSGDAVGDVIDLDIVVLCSVPTIVNDETTVESMRIKADMEMFRNLFTLYSHPSKETPKRTVMVGGAFVYHYHGIRMCNGAPP